MSFKNIKQGEKVYWNSFVAKCGRKLSNGKEYEVLKVVDKTPGSEVIQILDDNNKPITVELYNFISIEKFKESIKGERFGELTLN